MRNLATRRPGQFISRPRAEARPTIDAAGLAAMVTENHRAVVASFEKAKADTDKLSDKVAELGGRMTALEQEFVQRPGPGGGGPLVGGKSAGAEVVADSAFVQFAKSGARASLRVKINAAITSVPGGGGEALVAPDRRADIIGLAQTPLRVRDLLTKSRTNSNLVEFVRQTGFTNRAAVVSEGALKPESEVDFELDSAPIRTIAHFLVASKQLLDDAPRLVSFVDSELTYGLRYVEEQEILYGGGDGQHLFGIVPQATNYTAPFLVAAEQNLDTILLAIAQVEQTKFPATAVVLHPLDWRRMQALKDQENRYLGAGPYAAGPATVWGIPVVTSFSIGEGDFLVGSFAAGAELVDRQDVTFEVSSEDSDNFRKNLVTLRLESRVGLIVARPEVFVHGSFPNNT